MTRCSRRTGREGILQVIIDPELKVPAGAKILNKEAETIIFYKRSAKAGVKKLGMLEGKRSLKLFGLDTGRELDFRRSWRSLPVKISPLS